VTMFTNFRTKQKQKFTRNTQLSHKRRAYEKMREIKRVMFTCSLLSCLWMLCCVLMRWCLVFDSTIYFSVLVLFLLMKEKWNDGSRRGSRFKNYGLQKLQKTWLKWAYQPIFESLLVSEFTLNSDILIISDFGSSNITKFTDETKCE
jgi:hypothetical protein